MSRPSIFTPTEDSMLAKVWREKGTKCLDAFPGKTAEQLRSRASTLGLRKNNRHATESMLGMTEEDLLRPNLSEAASYGYLGGVRCSFVFDLAAWVIGPDEPH